MLNWKNKSNRKKFKFKNWIHKLIFNKLNLINLLKIIFRFYKKKIIKKMIVLINNDNNNKNKLWLN